MPLSIADVIEAAAVIGAAAIAGPLAAAVTCPKMSPTIARIGSSLRSRDQAIMKPL